MAPRDEVARGRPKLFPRVIRRAEADSRGAPCAPLSSRLAFFSAPKQRARNSRQISTVIHQCYRRLIVLKPGTNAPAYFDGKKSSVRARNTVFYSTVGVGNQSA